MTTADTLVERLDDRRCAFNTVNAPVQLDAELRELRLEVELMRLAGEFSLPLPGWNVLTSRYGKYIVRAIASDPVKRYPLSSTLPVGQLCDCGGSAIACATTWERRDLGGVRNSTDEHTCDALCCNCGMAWILIATFDRLPCWVFAIRRKEARDG